MKSTEIEKALKTKTHRPISIRRVAELKECDEGTVRHAIKTGALPTPMKMEKTNGKSQPFFLWHQVSKWKPGNKRS